MTPLPEEAVKAMPERIYAKVHGASTDVIRGQRGLIGGWNEHKRDGQAEYVRADLAVLSALEPSAARELALEGARMIELLRDAHRVLGGGGDEAFQETVALNVRYALEEYDARALSSPDHADAGKVEGDGCPRCGGKGEIVVGKGRHGDTIIEDCPSCSTPQDVINLVIAAREACDTWLLPECEFKRLDKALDAFSERVPFENEPDTLPSAPASDGAE
ncbi:hypothetical protein [Brucella pseudintermedia]|uniref:hypothetical protein n=1 Tax=Brucella pseudintermedia TaxID=370111 RepID=UPI00320A12A7